MCILLTITVKNFMMVMANKVHFLQKHFFFQDITKLSPLSPEVISRQATINIGTIGHVAHGKSTVVKAISGVQTVRFKNELERNITIKLGKPLSKLENVSLCFFFNPAQFYLVAVITVFKRRWCEFF